MKKLAMFVVTAALLVALSASSVLAGPGSSKGNASSGPNGNNPTSSGSKPQPK
jgi:hypothetical protein